ncbi:hypothetical protein ACFSQ7_31610 [Paenibacillus rhizoplanae]
MTLFFITLLPIIAATLVGTLISWVSSRFRASKILNMILTFAFIIVLMLGSFTLNQGQQAIADVGAALGDMIFKVYPPASVYVDAVCSYRVSALLFFIAVSVLAFMLFSVLLATRYKAIHTGLMTSRASRAYKMKPLQANSAFKALYLKELRRYFSSVNYVLNTGIGMVLLLMMSISLLFVSSEQLGTILDIPQLSDSLSTLSPLVISLFVVLSCTTACSISLEGNHLWILTSSPRAQTGDCIQQSGGESHHYVTHYSCKLGAAGLYSSCRMDGKYINAGRSGNLCLLFRAAGRYGEPEAAQAGLD